MKNLWHEIYLKNAFSPAAWLREQARFLGEKTNHEVVAEVKRMRTPLDTFYYGFDLFVEVISYRFRLFALSYEIDIFPIRIYPDERILKSVQTASIDAHGEKYFRLETQEQYIACIEYILGCEATKNILTAIVSHIHSEVSEFA
ncbi:MAG: hypothetical protein H7839_11120 [Magnetococcus sp. YQC-5]